MDLTPLTLKNFFADGEAPALNGAAVLAGLEDKLPGGEAMAGALDHALEEVFQMQLGDVLQASWSKVEGLMEALADSRANPGTVAIVPLVDHTVSSRHNPKIDLFIGRQRLAELALEIQLSLQLKGVALELREGRIAGLRAGECAGQGVCSLAGKALIDRKTAAIPLPGRLAFSAAKPQG